MLLVSGILIILCLFSIGVYSVYGDSSSPSIFLKGSVPYGIPYEDWVERWWEWNLQIPFEQHPISNPKLTDCAVGELESVSFLTPRLFGKSEFSCTIPAKNAILVPIGTGQCTTYEAQSNALEDMIKCATEGDKFLVFEASIDDVRLLAKMDPTAEFDQKIYVKTGIFNITIPENNFLNHPAGQWKHAAGGYFIFLKPLPEGDHRLSISARVTNPLDPSFNFDYKTLYLLKVQ